MQHVELVPLGELAQCADLLGDEGYRLLDAALARFLVTRAPPARLMRRAPVSLLA